MDQNFKNHRQFVPGFHGLTAILIIAGFIGAIINTVKSGQSGNLYSATLILALFIIAALLFWYTRVFSLKAQDRAIRAEENLRHFAMTGKLLPKQLRMSQIIALRFAPDEEFLELTNRAVAENLSVNAIKTAIKNWKADHHRA